MKINNLLKPIFSFFVFVILQVLLVKYFVLFDVAFCFIYIGFLITLPVSIPMPLLLIYAFSTGLFVDLFYDTIGIHAAAATVFMFIRPQIIRGLTPLGGYNEIEEISIKSMGIRWFITFTLLLAIFHHFIVFLLEAFGFGLFYWTLAKTFSSAIYSTIIIVSFQYIFFTSSKK